MTRKITKKRHKNWSGGKQRKVCVHQMYTYFIELNEPQKKIDLDLVI